MLIEKGTVMTTYVVPDGMKRKPTAEEWETLLENRIPELIRRAKAGNLDPNALNITMQKVIEGELMRALPAQTRPNILRLISGDQQIVIRATSGKRAIARATGIFTWGIDSDFKKWKLDVSGEEKPETPVEVHEMLVDRDFKTIFAGLGRELDDLCLTQEQIIAFVEDHKKWLRKEGFATFFLFKVNTEFFVAGVLLNSDERPSVYARQFSYDLVWDGDGLRRLVVPQTLKP